MLEILEEARREAPSRRARRRRAVGRARRRLAGRAPRARGRLRAPVPASRTPPARPARRRASCTCRAASSSRSRARSPTRPTSRATTSSTSPPTWAGSWGRGRSSAAVRRRDDRLRRGRARLARRPPLAARRGGARHDPRPLADADPRADPARRPEHRPLVAAHDRDDRRALEPGARTAGCSSTSAAAASRSSTARAAPRSAPASSRPRRRADQGVLGRRAGARDGDGRRRRRGTLAASARARSASSSAASPARDDARLLARPRALSRDVLAALPGIWTHGDWASVDEDGYWFLHGRSDDTLNIAGKRIGPAELESAAVAHPAVSEAAAVGVPHEVKGEVAWVFCVPCLGQPSRPTECGEARRHGRGGAREGVQARAVVFVARSRRRAPRRSSAAPCARRARRGSRRHVVAREPRGARGDRRRGRLIEFSTRSRKLMRLALAQINTVVGDLDGNRERILGRARRARAAGADLVLFPELAVTGLSARGPAAAAGLHPGGRALADADRRRGARDRRARRRPPLRRRPLQRLRRLRRAAR